MAAFAMFQVTSACVQGVKRKRAYGTQEGCGDNTQMKKDRALRWKIRTASCMLVLALGSSGAFAQSAGDPRRSGFENPPNSACPRVWWHWLNGNITKQGIQLDLEWMHRAGLGGFQNFDASLMTPQVVDHRLVYMTPEWKESFLFATKLADQLGLEEAIAGSPGWSETGGPWVPPAQAMKKLGWSETRVQGGTRFHGILPKPPANAGPFQNVLPAVSFTMHASVKVEKTEYKGWKNCYRVTNGEVEVIVTGDVGPRVIRFGFVGGQNLFKEFAEQSGKSGEETFQARGGDRVWKAPEDPIATWAPDNVPVEVQLTPTGLVAREPIEQLTKLQKEIEISMEPSGTSVRVAHRVTNHSLFPLEFAPWALTMMAQGGVAVSGFPPRGHHPANLQATNPLVMWAYTNLADPRWKFTKKYLTLRQDPHSSDPQKLGLFNPDTWAAYLLNGEAFIKRTKPDPSKSYPDFGCSFEIFTNQDFLEVETLGPMTKVSPGQTVELVEHWGLFCKVDPTALTDEELDRVLLPVLKAVGETE